MTPLLRVGIRPSPLALRQAEEARPYLEKLYPGSSWKVVVIATDGDIDKTTPLERRAGSDFFTRQIDEALLQGKIDVAVHSAKDLPEPLPEGLRVAWETDPLSPWDALVTADGRKVRELPFGSRVGTSSHRRQEGLRRLRPDLLSVDVRGTIEERLALIDQGRIDGLIVAHAALLRLGFEGRVAQVFTAEEFLPHPKQGRLSIVVRQR